MTIVGIYDSGCGGFSVLNRLLESNFKGQIFYYGDTLNNPWGNKKKEELASILKKIAAWFKLNNVTTIISGCNTTLGVFKHELTSIFETNVINALNNTDHHYLETAYSVLLTENSCKNNLFSKLLSKSKIQEIACPNLAKKIEMNHIIEAIELAKTYTQKCRYPHIILGCTHYPLIMDQLKTEFPNKIFINPTQFFSPKLNNHGSKIQLNFKTTGNEKIFNELIKHHVSLEEYTLNEINYLNTPYLLNQS